MSRCVTILIFVPLITVHSLIHASIIISCPLLKDRVKRWKETTNVSLMLSRNIVKWYDFRAVTWRVFFIVWTPAVANGNGMSTRDN